MRISDWSSDVCSSDLQKLASIPGTVPNLMQPPEGCRFRPRCDFAHDACLREPTLIESASAGHRAACWLLSEGAEAAAFEHRSEERRGGKECGSTFRSRWTPDH